MLQSAGRKGRNRTLQARPAWRHTAIGGIALLVLAGAGGIVPAAASTTGSVTVKGLGPQRSVPFGKTVTLTFTGPGLAGASATLVAVDTGGVPATSPHLDCDFGQQARTGSGGCPPDLSDLTTWSPATPTDPAPAKQTVTLQLGPWGLPNRSTINFNFDGLPVDGVAVLGAAAGSGTGGGTPGGAKAGGGGPDVSGKVTVECGSKFSVKPSASASYKVGGKVGLDGSITVTVPCGSNGKPVAAPKPEVAATSKPAAPPGTTLVIAGAGFAGSTKVTFGATSAHFTVVSTYEIKALVPAGKGSVYIRVTGPKGRSTEVSAARFRFEPAKTKTKAQPLSAFRSPARSRYAENAR